MSKSNKSPPITSSSAPSSTAHKEPEPAAIVGHVETIKIMDANREDGSSAMTINKMYTKHSWHMAQWNIRHADLKAKHESNAMTSQTWIYLEQDMYCLASSEGSHLLPFPKSSDDIHNREHAHETTDFGHSVRRNTHGALQRLMGLEEDDDETESADLADTNKTSLPPVATKSASKTNSLACLRHLTFSKDSEGRPTLNPRCIWRLLPVDLEGQIKSISQRDDISQRIMTKAARSLRRSENERLRREAVLRDFVPLSDDAETRRQQVEEREQYHGFAVNVRRAVLHQSHSLESLAMSSIRQKVHSVHYSTTLNLLYSLYLTCILHSRISATGGSYRRVFRHSKGSGRAGHRRDDAA